ncbi:relaxin receptor 1-like [Babylonia areolata]|uniref:relaxin receptor 1-like n=1 Tax=Babylonia areolata TaxID=304850 RepID=UPI003FD1CDE5
MKTECDNGQDETEDCPFSSSQCQGLVAFCNKCYKFVHDLDAFKRQCLCQGHALMCSQPFSAALFPQLRYLDAAGSGMTPSDVNANTYLIRLSLARCSLTSLPSMTLQNLRLLDLSANKLERAWIYRGFLWLITCLSVTGNIFCFCARLFAKSMTSSSGFGVFVTSLTIADFLMGVYIVIIGAADERFRGRYLYHDDSWKNSVGCKVAGFLSLLSSEVSAMTIWFITLDRFVVLHFPFSTLRFDKTSATVTCILTWLIGWFLAFLPLLPVTSHWEFYSQTGICIPLPITRQEFQGRDYSFGVLIVFNFVLFLLISAGQGFIYWSIQSNALKSNTTKASKDMTIARRLITVAVTDFMCWFPIGLSGMLALAGIPIPGEVNVALAIFILPLNAAINPFMYTLNTYAEKRRKSNEAGLLKWLESNADQIIG